ncbi:hypothetical protein B0T11DRAFT_313631 [Plectosphaerella cucumerina]|uniref:Uncharacterized protein n=1 Tax=Plectosphaerella cucumerina TaxID=40658 RepID=A0A8K0TR30_9PEZI|nr:hypothetical protein B0T11DRAFT_313631 [Plectosphaerella cucumerina]
MHALALHLSGPHPAVACEEAVRPVDLALPWLLPHSTLWLLTGEAASDAAPACTLADDNAKQTNTVFEVLHAIGSDRKQGPGSDSRPVTLLSVAPALGRQYT